MKLKILIPIIVTVVALVLVILFFDDIIVERKNKVMLIGYSKYSQRWIDIKNGALSASMKNGVDVSTIACDSKQKTLDQISMIEAAIAEDVKAIMLMPTNLSLLEGVLAEVKRNNINLIIIDDPAAIDQSLYVGTAVEELGINLAKDIERHDEPINVACVFTYDDSGKSVASYTSFVEYAKTHPKINLVSQSVCSSDINIAASIARSIIKENKANYIVCFDETITEGVASTVKRMMDEGKSMNLKVSGIGFADRCARYLEDDIITTLAVQNYYSMGYIALSNYDNRGNDNVFVNYVLTHKGDIFDGELPQILFDLK